MNHKHNYTLKRKKFFFFFLVIPVIIGILTFVVMTLWNALLPDLFGTASITFWQALGLLILCKILFGGFGCGARKKFGHGPQLRQKWRNMNEEEKLKFRKEWKRRCGK